MSRRLLVVLLLLAGPLAACTSSPEPPSTPPTPILETFYLSQPPGPGGLVLARRAGGVFQAYGAKLVQLRLRAAWPAELAVTINGRTITRVDDEGQHPELEAQGYFVYSVTPLPPGPVKGLSYFWKVNITIPQSDRPTGYMLGVSSVVANAQPTPASEPLVMKVAAVGPEQPRQRPSTIFDDGAENSKGAWSKRAIVARDVTLSGWLQGGEGNLGRNRAGGPAASEDWHYTIWLDEDFIERNYGPDDKPLLGAVMTGNQIEVRPGAPTISLLNGKAPTADTFMLPGLNVPNVEFSGFVVELNAWHISGRGELFPQGWVRDPERTEKEYYDNVWPFDPRHGSVGDKELKAGDYVILSGTLWQDSSHFGDPEDSDFKPEVYRYRHCWDGLYPNHGGWLEIHPVDWIQLAEPAPPLRRHVAVVGACALPGKVDDVDTYLSPTDVELKPPSERSVLKYRELIDDRFTRKGSLQVHMVDVDSRDPTKLHVRVRVVGQPGDVPILQGGSFKATYIMWWEEGQEVRATSPETVPDSTEEPFRPDKAD
jgi:hypothetical protein